MERARSGSDEIDVLGLLAKCVVSIRNNFKVLLLAFLLGTLAGTVFYMTFPKRYSSRLIIQSDILTEAFASSLFDDLDNLLQESNSQEASKKLGLTKDEASKIFSIEIESIKKERKEKSGELANAFTVKVQVFDNSILPKLQQGIISFLSNSEYVKIREEQRRSYYEGMIAKVDKELRSLDSMKQILFSRSTKTFGVMLIDPANIHRMALALNKEKFGFQNKLGLVNSVQVVNGFTAYANPSFPDLSYSLAGGASLGIIIITLIMGYKTLIRIVALSKEKVKKEGVALFNPIITGRHKT